ncbi:GNAT family N-acetyltransferase [Pedobacter hiemivivus]|uniref:GNAT family N-acetyltransferase n=1 Tax=Pedobacter hiemivivus TaxID=2530454 RepID=A0A4R0MZB3_9SPHI|nr:GNAT family N-acetyltransferase [Pedobacter hiemivivus]TCC92711.1 GNAT family N-acetyltransferase [Pedobacter hiemivivus]TKC56221.1 GNAT family N-acetyltransferase [Pedobacter hiemivivus]
MIKVITLSQKEEWDFYVKNAFIHDFYHTWHYHTLDESGVAILLVYEEDGDFIAFPCLKRKIPDSSFFDLSSVYGYVGPIANKENQYLSEALISNFKKAFLNFLKNEQIVSVFSRLHPFFDQDRLVSGFNGIYENGKTVALDLTLPIVSQRKKYSSSTYRAIRKSWKRGFSIRETKQDADVNTFIDIYLENMARINSTDYYLFSRQYFFDLINSNDFDCRLLLVSLKDEVVCGMIITFTHGIIQAHLVGTKEAYLIESPAKLLIDEITVLGRKEGMKYLHLGGGLGFREDTLFNWKSSFSDLFLDYKSFRHIVNDSVYQTLVQKQRIEKNATIDFFPLYRAVAKVLAYNCFELII